MSVFALVERLAPIVMSEVNLVIYSKQEAEALSSRLTRIQVGLKDAERIGVTHQGVKDWLKELEDVTYEIDDVLDELATADLQVEVQDACLHWDKVRSFLDCLPCFKQVVSRREITKRMKALSGKIDAILTKKGEYTFVSNDNDGTQNFRQEESTSLVSNEYKTYGLDDAKKSLLDKLILEGEGEGELDSGKNTQVISIVGVGGVGKSTLAREAYNDLDVDGHFAPKGWVSVSQLYEPTDIAKAILEEFGEKLDDARSLNKLVGSIKKSINQKRFLLVLDNVWGDDRNKWEEIKKCLDGGKGSRIVVTTRDESVARKMGSTKWQSLGKLSDTDCGQILNEVALEGRPREGRENLMNIGMKIAEKCNGLPLAAKSVGSMLALGSFTELEWKGVLESPLWTNGEVKTEVFRSLNLSYTALSPVLKRSFLSSGFFPKGTVISRDEMFRLWMAYGYLNSKSNINDVQKKGLSLLKELVMRSFFQRVGSGEVGNAIMAYNMEDVMSYKMHDIMHDFATHLSGSDGYSFIWDDGLIEEASLSSSHNNFSLGRLRTFSVCRQELRPDIVSHLTRVRVLTMRYCNLEGLPEDIGKLIHLRYLNVSDNPITQLPETITDLCNLQTLDIGGCNYLLRLPEGIEKLINLKHLVNTGTFKLMEYPQGLEELSGLWTLSEFRGSNFGYLKNLNQLQGSLLLDLGTLKGREVVEAEIWKKEQLKKLELQFGAEDKLDEVVKALKLPPNLQSLKVYSTWGQWLSHWFHTSSFHNLKAVSLHGNGLNMKVPPFGKLSALEELEILLFGFQRLRNEFLGLEGASTSSEVVGGFPKLKKLRLYACVWWKEWEDIKKESSVPVMRCLEELEIKRCPGLSSLPHNLLGKASSLRVVKLIGNQSLYLRYNRISGYCRDSIPLPRNQITWTVED